jgi:hypothetical protein
VKGDKAGLRRDGALPDDAADTSNALTLSAAYQALIKNSALRGPIN